MSGDNGRDWGETPNPSPRPVSDFSTPRLDDTSATQLTSLYDNEPERMQAAPAPFTDKYEQPTAMDSEMLDRTGMVKVQQQKKPRNAKEAVKGAVSGIWLTRHTVDSRYDKDRMIKATLRELIFYVIFLFLLCVIVYGSWSTTAYHLVTAMNTKFITKQYGDDTGITFDKIITKDEYWEYLKGPMMDNLYQDRWYDNKPIQDDDKISILHESKLMSTPILRLIKVKGNDSCKIEMSMKGLFDSCYPSYKQSREDKAAFGPIFPDSYNTTDKLALNYPAANGIASLLNVTQKSQSIETNITGWNHSSEILEDYKTLPYWGQISTYGGEGFIQELPSGAYTKNAKNRAIAIINHLQAGGWLDRGSRAVFLEFMLYNANLNLFIVARVSVEFPAMGGTVPHTQFRVVELLRYTTKFDKFVLVCEFIYCAFILYYLIEELIEICIHRGKYFKELWNLMDILVLLLSLLCIGFSVYRYLVVKSKITDYYLDYDGILVLRYKYSDFEVLAFVQNLYSDALAILVFFAWIKLFKYISFSKTMNSMNETLGRASKDIVAFGIMFFIFFFAYAQLGYLVFGANVKDYSSLKSSMFTLLRMILGDFKFSELEVANRIIGPLYFLTFIFLVIFVLINMFLAIIIDTYAEVKAELQTEKNEFDISDYLKRGYYNVLRRLHLRKDKLTDIQSTIDQAEAEHKQINYDEWKASLVERGFAESYVESMFAKYDTDGDRVLNAKEMRKLEADLHNEQGDVDQEEQGIQNEIAEVDESMNEPEDVPQNILTFEEFNVANIRLDSVEKELRKVLNDLDVIVGTLEEREAAKSRHREAIANIIAEKNTAVIGERAKTQNFMADVTSEMNKFMENYK